MATSALPTPAKPTINGTGTNCGVCGPSGAAAGMTAAVAGAGNGKTFPNNGGQTRLIVANVHATLAKTITPLRSKTVGGVAPVNNAISITAGDVRVFQFDSDYADPANDLVTVEAEDTSIKFLAIL